MVFPYFLNSFQFLVLVGERMQICHCIVLKWALIGQLGDLQKDLLCCYYHVQFAAVHVSCKRTVFYFAYANANLHLPINPFGLIVNSLYFSYDNVFF